ncbi:MAG: hypothetical protein AMK75_00980 [Planctomycetes bacterium SM23_65]|nr:MAG: hypothetical protein AMK75_00980 [Planctomycetes bacterium SM23_65]
MLWSYTDWTSDALPMVEAGELGGIISRGPRPANVQTAVEFTNDLQHRSPLPLLFLEDFEFGVGYLIRGATEFSSAMGLGATGEAQCAYEAGRITALEARALGYHVPIVPVLDVNVNPANPIINVRSFGEDPEKVAEFGVAFARGIEEAGCMACGKHFPGHGDTDVDSHRQLPAVPHDRARMDAVELVPFKRCIDAGISFIMSAHIVFPAVDPMPGLPATLSRKILTGLLRDELGFEGICVTDAMSMRAIADNFPAGEAEVRAAEAGADFILCMEPRVAYDALVAAVKSGRIDLERVRTSAARILAAKERMKLHEKRDVDAGAVASVVGTDAHREKALEIARKSMTLLRGETPCLRPDGKLLAVIVRTKRPTGIESHEVLAAELKGHNPSADCLFVDEQAGADAAVQVERRIPEADRVLFATFARVEAYKETSGGRAPAQEEIVRVLARSEKPFTAISFGSPYVLGRLGTAHNLLAAWHDSDVCIQAACEVCFGKLKPAGESPVTIPGL